MRNVCAEKRFAGARCTGAAVRFLRFAAVIFLLAAPTAAAASGGDSKLALKEGWKIQSSASVTPPPATLSSPGFQADGWYSASVPTTVVAALVRDKVYPDANYGMNLRAYPGMSYKIGANFSNEPMPQQSPFRVSWWYRTEFNLPGEWNGKTVWLNFRGINYRANIWLNGKQIARAQDVAGAFRRYEFDVSSAAQPGQANALAVEVFPPQPNDLAITFVDWNPLPPDKDMGLWGDVFLTTSGPVAIRNLFVQSKLEPDLSVAHLTVSAEVENARGEPIEGTLRGQIGEIQFSKNVSLAPNETKEVLFTPEDSPVLNIRHPQLWWPYRMGQPSLQELEMQFVAREEVSDRATLRFGIDEITAETNETGAKLFRINGKRILIRGAGWTPDMMLRDAPSRWADEFRYVKEMNLNTVRLEGKLVADEFFNLADRMGILIMAGWCCCDHWEKWGNWKSNELEIATASLKDQALRLRTHPSLAMWLNGSDNPPPADVEKAYLHVLQKLRWPKPVISSASAKKAAFTGPSGVKMTGPYDYVPPVYWLADTEHGGAFGFNTETSPGAAVPPIESLKLFLPSDHLWPIDDFWNYHAGGGEFRNLNLFTNAMHKRYGKARDLSDYVWKAQLMAYEGEKAMFESYSRNRFVSTGVIQWMLNNAWPSLIWHLYDYYLRPGAGYFATKSACEPLHIQFSEHDRSVVVVNDSFESLRGLKAEAAVYDLSASQKYAHEQQLDFAPDSSSRVFDVPEIPGISAVYFVKLNLRDSAGKILSTNFYWLSTKPDVLDNAGAQWYYTPESSYADLTALSRLPEVKLESHAEFQVEGEEGVARARISNPTKQIALLVRLRVTRRPEGDEILPVWWEDNYVSLLPGESREITARYRLSDLGGAKPALAVDGWNVARNPAASAAH